MATSLHFRTLLLTLWGGTALLSPKAAFAAPEQKKEERYCQAYKKLNNQCLGRYSMMGPIQSHYEICLKAHRAVDEAELIAAQAEEMERRGVSDVAQKVKSGANAHAGAQCSQAKIYADAHEGTMQLKAKLDEINKVLSRHLENLKKIKELKEEGDRMAQANAWVMERGGRTLRRGVNMQECFDPAFSALFKDHQLVMQERVGPQIQKVRQKSQRLAARASEIDSNLGKIDRILGKSAGKCGESVASKMKEAGARSENESELRRMQGRVETAGSGISSGGQAGSGRGRLSGLDGTVERAIGELNGQRENEGSLTTRLADAGASHDANSVSLTCRDSSYGCYNENHYGHEIKKAEEHRAQLQSELKNKGADGVAEEARRIAELSNRERAELGKFNREDEEAAFQARKNEANARIGRECQSSPLACRTLQSSGQAPLITDEDVRRGTRLEQQNLMAGSVGEGEMPVMQTTGSYADQIQKLDASKINSSAVEKTLAQDARKADALIADRKSELADIEKGREKIRRAEEMRSRPELLDPETAHVVSGLDDKNIFQGDTVAAVNANPYVAGAVSEKLNRDGVKTADMDRREFVDTMETMQDNAENVQLAAGVTVGVATGGGAVAAARAGVARAAGALGKDALISGVPASAADLSGLYHTAQAQDAAVATGSIISGGTAGQELVDAGGAGQAAIVAVGALDPTRTSRLIGAGGAAARGAFRVGSDIPLSRATSVLDDVSIPRIDSLPPASSAASHIDGVRSADLAPDSAAARTAVEPAPPPAAGAVERSPASHATSDDRLPSGERFAAGERASDSSVTVERATDVPAPARAAESAAREAAQDANPVTRVGASQRPESFSPRPVLEAAEAIPAGNGGKVSSSLGGAPSSAAAENVSSRPSIRDDVRELRREAREARREYRQETQKTIQKLAQDVREVFRGSPEPVPRSVSGSSSSLGRAELKSLKASQATQTGIAEERIARAAAAEARAEAAGDAARAAQAELDAVRASSAGADAARTAAVEQRLATANRELAAAHAESARAAGRAQESIRRNAELSRKIERAEDSLHTQGVSRSYDSGRAPDAGNSNTIGTVRTPKKSPDLALTPGPLGKDPRGLQGAAVPLPGSLKVGRLFNGSGSRGVVYELSGPVQGKQALLKHSSGMSKLSDEFGAFEDQLAKAGVNRPDILAVDPQGNWMITVKVDGISGRKARDIISGEMDAAAFKREIVDKGLVPPGTTYEGFRKAMVEDLGRNFAKLEREKVPLDLKPENFVVNGKGEFVLVDRGLSSQGWTGPITQPDTWVRNLMAGGKQLDEDLLKTFHSSRKSELDSLDDLKRASPQDRVANARAESESIERRADATGRDPAEVRADRAEEVLGRKLTSAERGAVTASHEVGQGGAIGSYTAREIAEKDRILARAGFKKPERETLIRRGITGAAEEISVQRTAVRVTDFEQAMIRRETADSALEAARKSGKGDFAALEAEARAARQAEREALHAEMAAKRAEASVTRSGTGARRVEAEHYPGAPPKRPEFLGEYLGAGVFKPVGGGGEMVIFRGGTPRNIRPGDWVTADIENAENYAKGFHNNGKTGEILTSRIPREHLYEVHPGGWVYIPPGTSSETVGKILRHKENGDSSVTLRDVLRERKASGLSSASVSSSAHLRDLKELTPEQRILQARMESTAIERRALELGRNPLEVRQERAGEILGRKLSRMERDAVRDAHLIGGKKRIGEYSAKEIARKDQMLRSAGFPKAERELLIRQGITGGGDDLDFTAYSAKATSEKGIMGWDFSKGASDPGRLDPGELSGKSVILRDGRRVQLGMQMGEGRTKQTYRIGGTDEVIQIPNRSQGYLKDLRSEIEAESRIISAGVPVNKILNSGDELRDAVYLRRKLLPDFENRTARAISAKNGGFTREQVDSLADIYANMQVHKLDLDLNADNLYWDGERFLLTENGSPKGSFQKNEWWKTDEGRRVFSKRYFDSNPGNERDFEFSVAQKMKTAKESAAQRVPLSSSPDRKPASSADDLDFTK